MKKKRIVVTGMSVLSCIGNEVDSFYKNLLAGVSGIGPITEFACEDYPTRFAGVIKDFDPGEYIEKKQARRVDKSIAYSIVSGKKALEMAHLPMSALDTLDKARCGVLIGTGIGGMTVFSDGVATLLEKGHKRLTPFFIPYVLTNMGGALLATDLGFMGPNYSISTACATANYAIIAAANHMRNGESDLIVCGGVEAPITPIGLAGFCACKALSQRNEDPTAASRPFDLDRDGFVMGEGAGVLVLETLEHAQKRGAPIYAEYLGGGISCDAYHMTEPRPDGSGVAVCIRNALADASVDERQVNYINAHATSTSAGDVAELRALKQVFSQTKQIKINATKSLIGHSLGAAGGMEAIATIEAINKRKIHATRNLKNPVPELLDFSFPLQEEELDVEVAISNSFGFGGHNATVVFAPFRA